MGLSLPLGAHLKCPAENTIGHHSIMRQSLCFFKTFTALIEVDDKRPTVIEAPRLLSQAKNMQMI